ncbi:MAG: AAA family ATPase, partial [Rhodospirillaceae bacterium]|nr:AAA family ATPase [Rhodospirillaceae bacterium]
MSESFEFQIPRHDKQQLSLFIPTGEVLFVLGANGTGKSNLLHRLYNEKFGKARRISAHRQTWFSENSITLSPQQKRQTETNIQAQDRQPNSRYMDPQSAQRPSIAIFDLIDAQNVRSRAISEAVDDRNLDLSNLISTKEASRDVVTELLQLSKKKAPIAVINDLLKLSGLPIVISVRQNEEVLATKPGSEPYSIAELSDGERNAILIAADVLTVKPGTLILIDEPERHLHRSIISPLLTQLFAERSDCAFVVSTHEVMLPLDNPNSETLLIRGCTYENKVVCDWDADLIPATTEIDEKLKRDILGARRKILFVEGTESSRDKPLYSLLFPNTSVLPKGSCKNVEQTVSSIRESDNLHWIHAFGIIDNDGRSDDEIERLKDQGIYALSVFSVESIYYHPQIQRAATELLAKATGENPLARIEQATAAAIKRITERTDYLSKRAAERILREQLYKHIPGKAEIDAGDTINISLDVQGAIAAERAVLEKAILERN